MSKRVKRLYRQFKPIHYDLNLTPDRNEMTLQGTVTIAGQKTGPPSQRLTFHQHGLTITSATITRHDKKGTQSFAVTRINHQKKFDEVRLHTKEMLYPGSYSVTMQFEGFITRPMNGVYPCTFEVDGQTKQLIATQFESHHAREAFPGIDEPEAKATFDLTLATLAGEVVIANTPAKAQHKKGKQLVTTFETTPKMSTYLLAFVYGDLQYREAKTTDGVVVRTYATPGNVQYTAYALDVAVKCLEFFTDYFGIPYPLAKCDLVALPDFASGAMENWGLITFREQSLLMDPKHTSLSLKQYIVMVVAHELAHQWFGNLVTMRWWTDLWLNEGFASWMEYYAADYLFPEWHMWTEFIVHEQEGALKLDALEHTHPIEVPVNHPDEIRTIFDAISYSKGSSVLNMLYHYLGDKLFREGLQQYLKHHAYGNTDTVDLWTALEETSHKPVRDFMNKWTAQPGFPLVRADVEDQAINLAQQRFFVNPTAKTTGETWPVPLLSKTLMANEELTVRELKTETAKPADLLLNQGRNGFYRVVYDVHHLKNVAKKLHQLDEFDRLGLLSDAFEAAKAGYTSTAAVLELLSAYKKEDNTFVWDIISGGLGSIRAVMNDETLRETMKPFTRQLVAKQLSRLGWQPTTKEEPHFDTLLRPTVLALASVSDEPSVIMEAKKRFDNMKNSEELDPDLRGVIYGTVARTGDSHDFDKLLALHNASKNSEEQVTLAAALTSFKQPALINRALKQINSDNVRLQDVSYWLAYSFMNRFGRDATWQWMTEYWPWLEKNLGHDLSFFNLPLYAARVYSDAAFLPTYKAFFAKHLSPAFKRPFEQGLETIKWQAAWRQRDLDTVKAFFANQPDRS